MPNFIDQVTVIFSTWHITRAAGLTAYLLLFLTTTGGLLLSLQTIPAKYRSSITTVHNTIGLAGIFFTLLHLSVLLFDKHINFSLIDVLIPFWSSYQTWESSLGIIAFYTMTLIAFASIPAIMKRLGYRLWRGIHYLAFFCYWIALYHSVGLGTDSTNLLVLTIYLFSASIVIALTLLRMKKSMQGRGVHYAHSARGR